MSSRGYKTKTIRSLIEELRSIVRGHELGGFLSLPSDTPNHKLLFSHLSEKYHSIIRENKMDLLLSR